MHALFDLLGAIALGAWGFTLCVLLVVVVALAREALPARRRPRHAPPRPIHVPGVRQLARDLAASADDAAAVDELLADDAARWRARFPR